MHDEIFHLLIFWQLGLFAAVVVLAARARDLTERLLALEAAALVVGALLALVAIHRGEAGYLDVAIALALFGFLQSVAAARLAAERGERS